MLGFSVPMEETLRLGFSLEEDFTITKGSSAKGKITLSDHFMGRRRTGVEGDGESGNDEASLYPELGWGKKTGRSA